MLPAVPVFGVELFLLFPTVKIRTAKVLPGQIAYLKIMRNMVLE